jgi:hypothetical protein
MNQGNSGKYKKYNGVFQDGALIFRYGSGKHLAFFLAFQSQTFQTDKKGNPTGGGKAAPPARKSRGRKAKARKATQRSRTGRRRAAA